MNTWSDLLRIDPMPALEAADDAALSFFVRRDLLGEGVGSVAMLSELPEAQRILRRQQGAGSWRYPGQNRRVYTETNYDLLETFRQLGLLVEKYGMTRQHPAIERAAEYLLSCQTEEGDIRGILGTQYMPYYHGVITELLIKVGYEDDPRVEKGLEWLLAVRQTDGGWIVPMQQLPSTQKIREVWSAPPILPDRQRPHAHLATGMALRAFAVHPRYQQRQEVQKAAHQLKARFFQSDRYNDRKAPGYWTKFQFPFWWTNILTALDTLSLLGFHAGAVDVQKALEWFVSHQETDGLWKTSYEQAKRKEPSAKEKEARNWVGLAVCRVFKRFLGQAPAAPLVQ